VSRYQAEQLLKELKRLVKEEVTKQAIVQQKHCPEVKHRDSFELLADYHEK
jgi:hypothetical protein